MLLTMPSHIRFFACIKCLILTIKLPYTGSPWSVLNQLFPVALLK
jgi:hypothetical protein